MSRANWTSELVVSDPDEMHELGLALGELLRAGDLLLLTGPLGAGKTTLTRGIGAGLGVRGPITSPTFVLARSHPSLGDGARLTHLDAYRLSGADELDDLDLDFAGSVVVAEWGRELLGDREPRLEVTIRRPTGADAAPIEDWTQELVEPRLVTVEGFGERWEGERFAWQNQ